jgi:hypothetical protein
MIQMSSHSLAFPGGAYFVRAMAARPVQSHVMMERRDPTSRHAAGRSKDSLSLTQRRGIQIGISTHAVPGSIQGILPPLRVENFTYN